MNEAFADVARLPGLADAVTESRDAVDRLLDHRILRRRAAEVRAESALRGARASAALEGVAVPLDIVRNGSGDTVRDGPGADHPVVQGALRVCAEAGLLIETWRRAPRQVLARLHVLAASGLVPAGELGRPRTGEQIAEDPFRLGAAPAPIEVMARLDALGERLAAPTRAPALVVAAMVHGELLTLRPFGRADGMVARAAERIVLAERGLDAKSLVAPEVGHAELAQEYADALRAYADGTPAGVARWVRHCADAVVVAARDALAVCEALARG